MNQVFQCRIFFVFLLFFTTFSRAQQSDLDLLIDDLLIVAGDFALPAAEATVYQADAGWASSAKTLDLWEVKFSLHGNVLFVPDKKTSTKIANSNYAILKIRGGTTAEVPTAFGGETDVFYEGEVSYLGQTREFELQALEGIDEKIIVHPFVQAAVGLPFHTELSLRFVPKVEIKSVEVSTFGLGLKHNFNQYFPNSKPTSFQFAALLAFNHLEVNYASQLFEIEELLMVKTLEVNSDIWSLQLLSSKHFANSNWEVFGILDLSNANFEYSLGGGGPALVGLNEELEELGDNDMAIIGQVGFNYHFFKNFNFSTAFSFGDFYNLNVAVHYKL